MVINGDPLKSMLMGCPTVSEVKGNALMFSVYFVRKSMTIASSFAFRTETWLTIIEVRQAAVKNTMIPRAIIASTRVKAAAFLSLENPQAK